MPKTLQSYDKGMKFRWLRRDIKAAAFLTWLAEKFSPPSAKKFSPPIWPIFEEYLLLTEQLHFWTGYV